MLSVPPTTISITNFPVQFLYGKTLCHGAACGQAWRPSIPLPVRACTFKIRQTGPEIVNHFNRTFFHLKSGVIFAAYTCPKGVLSINELREVRHFDFCRQRALYKHKIWRSKATAFWESPKMTGEQAGRQATVPTTGRPRAKSPPAPRGTRLEEGAGCTGALAAPFPYIVKEQGIPLWLIFYAHSRTV